MLFDIRSQSSAPDSLLVSPARVPEPAMDIDPAGAPGPSEAILGGGCFWCVDGVYRMIDGVLDSVSGYAGGTADTANYRDVCSGNTGHAEVVKVVFDPSKITYGQILRLFFAVAHDPTQLNRQDNDVGPQYRSAIFTKDVQQQHVAEAYIRQLGEAGVFKTPIVTEVAPLEAFYEGEGYHQDYAALNPMQPYIACIAVPKMKKLREYFPGLLK